MGDRFALVIGNSKYNQDVGGLLPNCRGDAEDVSAALRRLRFEVTPCYDATLAEMNKALHAFEKLIHGSECALLFFAGHGVESSKGTNYLLPTDAWFDFSEDDSPDLEQEQLDRHGFAVPLVARKRMRGARKRLLFLDACRRQPVRTRSSADPKPREIFRDFGSYHAASAEIMRDGLGPMTEYRGDDAKSILIVFATASGEGALDSARESPNHSPFTQSFLSYVEEPGIKLAKLLEGMTEKLHSLTDDRQDLFVSPHNFDFIFDPAAESGRPNDDAFLKYARESGNVEVIDFQLGHDPESTSARELQTVGEYLLVRMEDTERLRRISAGRRSVLAKFAFERLATIEWRSVSDSSDIERVKAFIREFAGTSTIELADERLFHLSRESDWRGTDGCGVSRTLVLFIDRYEAASGDKRGRDLIGAAKSQLGEAYTFDRWIALKASGTLSQIREMISALGGHPLTADMRSEISRRADERWAEIADSRDRAILKQYLSDFPGELQIALVERRLREIDLDEAWQIVKDSKNRADFEDIIVRNLDKRYAELARARLREIERELELYQKWDALRAAADVTQIRAFRSELGPDCVDLIAKIDGELSLLADEYLAEASDGPALYQFIELFPSDIRCEIARTMLRAIEREDAAREALSSVHAQASRDFIAAYGEGDDDRGQELIGLVQERLDYLTIRDTWVQYTFDRDGGSIEEILASTGDDTFAHDLECEIERLAEVEWCALENTSDIASLESFVRRFLGLPLAVLAQQKKDDLLQEAEWREIDGSWDELRLKQFVQKYSGLPENSRVDVLIDAARDQIGAIILRKRWHAIITKGSFIEAEAFSSSINEAINRIELGGYTRKAQQLILEEVREFLEQRPQWERQRQADWEATKDSRNERDLTSFVQAYDAGSTDEAGIKMISAAKLTLGLIAEERAWGKGIGKTGIS